jgi:AcrR family transcriptional regulator
MTDPIQQQRIAARTNQILDAAAAVFAEKGFHATTTRDIARRAGIAEGTIYTYFATKTAILMGIFERMKAAVLANGLPPAAADGDMPTIIRAMLQHPWMDLKTDNFALFRIVLSEMMVNEELRGLYYAQILEPTLTLAETMLADHAARRGLSPTALRLTIRAVAGMIMGLMLEHIMGDSTLADHWDDVPDIAADLIINGFGT